MRGFVILVLGCLAIWPGRIAAGEVDRARMQRDLEIMEGILPRLLQDPGHGIGAQSAHGLYVEGYGVVFLVDGGGSHRRYQAVSVERVAAYSGDFTARIDSRPGEEAGGPGAGTEDTGRDSLKARVAEFLRSYAGAIGQLKDSDRISVVVAAGTGLLHRVRAYRFNPDPHSSALTQAIKYGDALVMEADSLARRLKGGGPDSAGYRKLGYHFKGGRAPLVDFVKGKGGERASILGATVRRTDVEAFSRGRIDEKAFQERIVFKEQSSDAPVFKKVRIMAGILDTALGSRRYGVGLEARTVGIYLEGVGALFFRRRPFDGDFYFTGMQDPEAQRAALIEAVADYGHTLRPLKPSEYIVVEVDPDGGRGLHRKGGRLILKVRKEAVDAYHRGEIDLEGFRERVKMLEL